MRLIFVMPPSKNFRKIVCISFYLYCSVSNLDLRPLETPNISFRADVAGLRQSIKKFGKVDSRGCPLETAFAGKSQESESSTPHL